MKLFIFISLLFASSIMIGQNITFLKTDDSTPLHYLQIYSNYACVYKMGRYFDKGATSPAIKEIDTLTLMKQNEYKGELYSLFKDNEKYTLISNTGKKYRTKPESEAKVNAELNKAHCLKSYIDLSHRLNEQFPLNRYTFRNGYFAWEREPNKSIKHADFVRNTDKEMMRIYDSVSKKQNSFINTTKFISDNVIQADYSVLKDSISKLPIDYKPQSAYFDKSVYQMSKSNPEYFYKLLQDFPSGKSYIYSAVEQDKALIKQLKQLQGYNDLKKEFFKQYKAGKLMLFRAIAMYAVFIGVIIVVIVRS